MMTANTKTTIAVNMLATIPITVGLVLLVQEPQKLKITTTSNASLFEYKL